MLTEIIEKGFCSHRVPRLEDNWGQQEKEEKIWLKVYERDEVMVSMDQVEDHPDKYSDRECDGSLGYVVYLVSLGQLSAAFPHQTFDTF